MPSATTVLAVVQNSAVNFWLSMDVGHHVLLEYYVEDKTLKHPRNVGRTDWRHYCSQQYNGKLVVVPVGISRFILTESAVVDYNVQQSDSITIYHRLLVSIN